MAGKKFIWAVIGFISLNIFVAIVYMLDFAVVYAIFLYLQSLFAPFIVAVDYFFYVVRLSIPYFFMYILICMFFNIQSYKRNSTIRFLKYSIDINTVKKTKIYVYARQYNYILIIALNLFLLFVVYYAYINNKYFYLLFVFLFYVFIWIVIKIKHLLFKNENLQYKKVHMLVNLILVVLVGTYISMSLEDLNISNVKLYGFENFWKLLDNKYFIKMPSKDFNWNRLFNWSKQTSTDRYMFALKKSLMNKTQVIEHGFQKDVLSNETVLVPYNNLQNDDINLNKNVNIADYLHKMQNDDYHMGRFTNAFYQKFKKVFLMQLQIKSTNFMPTSEINARFKLFYWLKNPFNIIDLSKFYISESTESMSYNDYLDLVDKKFNNFTSKKVFLITLHKNYYNLKSFAFFADFEDSFKKNYAMFLNSEKYNIDLKNNSILNFEYYNSDLYINFDFNDLWLNFKNELSIVLKDHNMSLSLFKKDFKALFHIKSFKFSFKEDVLSDSDRDSMLDKKFKPKKPYLDLKKLQAWKTFKLNYKEIIYNYTKELRLRGYKNVNLENKWLANNKIKIPKAPFNEIFFWVEDDIVYSLSDYIKLKQVEDLTFSNFEYEDNQENFEYDDDQENFEYDDKLEYEDMLSEYVSYYLENIKSKSKALYLISTKKFTKIFINDVEKSILNLQQQRIHVPLFNSIYHEIMYQNASANFKYILENFEFSRDLLTISRSFMTFEMWNAVMHKLLNLNLNSMYLKNITDFNDFCKSDFTEDLQFNFSLAFDIIQNKYDLFRFQIIPDLEGIPGTFYEYTVKYNQHMDKYYWYEEQEALIDWIYEISYYSLVNIMDTVKEVDGKENDFLYDMINMYLREPKYKWIAEMYENRENFKPTKLLIFLNKKIDLLNELEDLQKKKELQTFKDRIDFNYGKVLENTNLMDFDNVNDLHQLNWKIGRDLNFFKTLFKWQMHQVTLTHPDMVDDLHIIHHTDVHKNEFELMMQYYIQERENYNWDQGVLGGVAIWLNHKPDFIEFEVFEEFFELKEMYRLEFFLEEMDSLMHVQFDQLLETEQFDYWLVDGNTLIIKNFNFILCNYKEALLEAHFNILNKMFHNIDFKKSCLLEVEQKVNKLDKISIEYEKLKCIELRNMQLDKLPIFDWYTYTYIEENISILEKENKDLLLKKLDLLEKQLELDDLRLKEMKKVTKLYGKKIIRNSVKNPQNPLTKQYLEKNWDDYNYLANKKDKLMHEWPKAGKKK